MWSLARGMAQYSLKSLREYLKAQGALPPPILDIMSHFFVNILPSALANLHILLQYVTLLDVTLKDIHSIYSKSKLTEV